MTLYALEDNAPNLPEDSDFWIAPDANVIGNVLIGSACSIWFGTTIRGDNEPITLGAGTNIQENCVLHTDPGFPLTLGEGCTIGHKAMLHGCQIGENTLIGMGATILNGAKIGANCLIGAGALVTEGKVVEDGMMAVGAPARPVRALSEEQIAALRGSALHYQARMRLFREHLREL